MTTVWDLNAVAVMTQGVADQNGWDGFLPTLIDPQSRTIAVLEDIPPETTQKDAAREWMRQKYDGAPLVFLAYKLTEGIEVSQFDHGQLTATRLLTKQSDTNEKP